MNRDTCKPTNVIQPACILALVLLAYIGTCYWALNSSRYQSMWDTNSGVVSYETALYPDEIIMKRHGDYIVTLDFNESQLYTGAGHPVIPAGELRPLQEVLEDLGIAQERLGCFRWGGMNSIRVSRWQLSESFDLVCWSHSGGLNYKLGADDPTRLIYSVKIVRPSRDSQPGRRNGT